MKKIDFFFGIYYTLKRTAKFAAKFVADMAQLVERVLGKDEVTGSNPVISSIKMPDRTKKVRSGVFLFSARIFSLRLLIKTKRAHIAPYDTHS